MSELRGRIIQVFFKHLTSSNEVAVDMSQEGLAAVIAFQKMPKTLLQVHNSFAPGVILSCNTFCLEACHNVVTDSSQKQYLGSLAVV